MCNLLYMGGSHASLALLRVIHWCQILVEKIRSLSMAVYAKLMIYYLNVALVVYAWLTLDFLDRIDFLTKEQKTMYF